MRQKQNTVMTERRLASALSVVDHKYFTSQNVLFAVKYLRRFMGQ